MRNYLVIVFSLVLVFTSSCAMKRIALDFLEAQNRIPIKTLPVAENDRSNLNEACLGDLENGNYMDYVELASAPDVVKAGSPVYFVVALLFAFTSLSLLPFLVKVGPGTGFQSRHPVPIYLRLKQLVYYA